MIERAFSVSLTIPDNEAYTALVTLQRMGVACARIVRADIHVFGVEADRAHALEAVLPTIATVFNPNKHRMGALASPRPDPGEAWIAPRELPATQTAVVLGGIALPGVSTVLRATSWRLFDERADLVATAVLDRAVETLLCNPAFQRAIR